MPDGRVLEIFLDDRRTAARVECPPGLIPLPGQYLLAHNPASDDPLAIPVFSAGDSPSGFLVVPPLPRAWSPGLSLSLRGPLGHGFALPAASRRVALAALDASPAYLLGLIPPSFAQGASVSLVCDSPSEELPADVEIHPLAALADVTAWADYLALVIPREALPGLMERLGRGGLPDLPRLVQVLILAPMPCGALAECGVCSLETKRGVKLICEAGPVFDLPDLL